MQRIHRFSAITIGFGLMVSVGTAEAQKIYWVENNTGKVRAGNIDGFFFPTDLFDSSDGLSELQDIALDVDGGKVYWAAAKLLQPSAAKIQVGNINGSGIPTALFDNANDGLSAPFGIALDVDGGKIYWTDWITDKIQVGNIDGSGTPTDLFDSADGLEGPTRIALDVAGGKIYWTDGNTDKVQVGNIDGTGFPVDLFDGSDGVNDPIGIALDVAGGKVYWTSSLNTTVKVGNIDGLGSPTVLFDSGDGVNSPHGIALDVVGGKIYWAARNDSVIRAGNIDGSGSVTNVYGQSNGLPDSSDPQGIALDLTPSPPLPASSSYGLVLFTLLLVATALNVGRIRKLAAQHARALGQS